MPDVVGEWTDRTLGIRLELDDVEGTFMCVAPGAGNHGPARVRDVHHLAYEDGTRYYQAGTTCYAWAPPWNFAGAGMHQDDYVLVYFGSGSRRATSWTPRSPEAYAIELIDTWGMTMERLEGKHSGRTEVGCPASPTQPYACGAYDDREPTALLPAGSAFSRRAEARRPSLCGVWRLARQIQLSYGRTGYAPL